MLSAFESACTRAHRTFETHTAQTRARASRTRGACVGGAEAAWERAPQTLSPPLFLLRPRPHSIFRSLIFFLFQVAHILGLCRSASPSPLESRAQ
eukprot:2218019-Pleurochrysis_carterae.AAC.1